MKKGIMATRSIRFILSRRKLENLDIFSLSETRRHPPSPLFIWADNQFHDVLKCKECRCYTAMGII